MMVEIKTENKIGGINVYIPNSILEAAGLLNHKYLTVSAMEKTQSIIITQPKTGKKKAVEFIEGYAIL